MPVIKPFRALLYNSAAVKIENVVAPPYDVISPEQQSDLYNIDAQNVIRLILNREPDPYASAASQLKRWLEENVIIRDAQPALYVISQRYTVNEGEPFERHGFVAACEITELGKGVHPHERTHPGPKEDRLKLFKATN